MGLYYHFQIAITFKNLISFIYISFEKSCKTPVKKDLMTIILFKTYEHLKLYTMLCIFHVPIYLYIYQTIHSSPNKFKSYPPNFGNVSSTTMKKKQFQVFSLMRSLIIIAYMQPLITQRIYIVHWQNPQESLRKSRKFY